MTIPSRCVKYGKVSLQLLALHKTGTRVFLYSNKNLYSLPDY